MKKFGLFLLMLLMVSGLVLGGCATEPENPSGDHRYAYLRRPRGKRMEGWLGYGLWVL